MDDQQSEHIHEVIQSGETEEANSNSNGDFVNDDDINMKNATDPTQSVNGNDQSSDANCLVRLLFRDSETFDELHQVIGQCIRNALFQLQKPANLIVEKDDNCVRISEITAKNDESNFMVDTLPTDNTNEEEIPSYKSTKKIDVLNNQEHDVDENEADIDDGNKPKMGNCWNCGGDHNMRDCKEKRDPNAISRAKQQFAQKPKSERYHLDAEQRYSHLTPGKVSDGLRQALGLRSRELPLYVYKMRLYGYPQGWLEEAKINHSGLSLIHSDTKSSNDNDGEDGEVDKVTFDPSKFIEYPGFNAPVPSNLIDEGDFYRVPPMQFQYSKEGLTLLLQDNLTKTYKRKRLKLDVDDDLQSQNVKDDDMDVQGSDEEKTESPVLFPQPRPDTVDESNSNAVPDEESSLLELERKKEELRRALEEDACSDSNSNSIPSDPNGNGDGDGDSDGDVDDNDKAAENETIQSASDINQTDNDTTQTGSINDEKTIEESTTDTKAESIEIEDVIIAEQTQMLLCTPSASPSVSGTPAGRSRESVSGTPLIKQVSPYTKLPIGDKWSAGVTDVIDFENLPDATGTYQKLTGVIKRVRTVIKRINDDSDHESS